MAELKVLHTEKKYAGKVIDLIIDEIEYPSGSRSVREVAAHPGGAAIVPLLPDNNILLVKQYRYPIRQIVYELPAGKLNPGEDPEVCARRELEEETGYRAEQLQRLTSIYTTPGFCNEQLHLFLASGLEKSSRGQQLEEGEASLTVETVPLKRVLEMIDQEEIVDAKTLCGIFLAERLLSGRTVQ
jgi:ADP-ribose pyrophosphatase